MAMMPIAGFLIGRRWDMLALLTDGLIVSVTGVYMFSFLNMNAGPWNFFWPQIVMGVGLSFMFVPLTTITVDPIPKEEMGYATSLIALSRNLGAIGISVFTAFHRASRTIPPDSIGCLHGHGAGLPSLVTSALQSYLGYHGRTQSPPGMALIYHDLLQRAAALSYLDGFRIIAFLLLVAARSFRS